MAWVWAWQAHGYVRLVVACDSEAGCATESYWEHKDDGFLHA